jgi:RNA polymerase sigma factor (sigma-70 family)
MPDDVLQPLDAEAGQFATTHWSVVLAAGRTDDSRSHDALSRLCQAYWYPLYAFVRRHGYSPHDAQDLTQAFFAHLLEKNALASADRAKGKFRSFLVGSLTHFMANDRHRARAQKRGGGCVTILMDIESAESRYGLEAAEGLSPDKSFERNWALRLMEQVFQRLRREQTATGKGKLFDRLQGCLMADPDAPGYAELSAQLGMKAEAIRMTVSRLRHRYRELLRDEIAQTVSGPAELEEEIQHLFVTLGR